MRALKTIGMQANPTQEKMENLNAVWNTYYIYGITVQKVSEKHPNKISKRIIIMSAMLTQERFRHAEHLLAYVSSDILLLLSVWLKPQVLWYMTNQIPFFCVPISAFSGTYHPQRVPDLAISGTH